METNKETVSERRLTLHCRIVADESAMPCENDIKPGLSRGWRRGPGGGLGQTTLSRGGLSRHAACFVPEDLARSLAVGGGLEPALVLCIDVNV